MKLIDSHCHLDFLKKPKKVIHQATKNQVNQIICPGISAVSSRKCIRLAQKHNQVFAAVGLHPMDINAKNQPLKEQIQLIKELLNSSRNYIVAIGETGLDLGNPPQGKTPRSLNDQLELFNNHIKLASKYGLPLIIHNRKAENQLLQALQPFKGQVSGVFHCFTGSKKFLNQIIGLGFYVGVGGLVTYDQGLQAVIKEVPCNKILLETDSPYLMPEPIRSRKKWPNEPKNVKIVAEKVAELKGDSLLSVAQQTTKNTYQLFGLS